MKETDFAAAIQNLENALKTVKSIVMRRPSQADPRPHRKGVKYMPRKGATKQISFYMELDIYDLVRNAAIQQNDTITAWICKAIRERLERDGVNVP